MNLAPGVILANPTIFGGGAQPPNLLGNGQTVPGTRAPPDSNQATPITNVPISSFPVQSSPPVVATTPTPAGGGTGTGTSWVPIAVGAGAVLALLYFGNKDKKRRRR